MNIIIFTVLLLASCSHAAAYPGIAYEISFKYGLGSKEWQEANDAWLESNGSDPYPDDLRDIDGNGYKDGKDAAINNLY